MIQIDNNKGWWRRLFFQKEGVKLPALFCC